MIKNFDFWDNENKKVLYVGMTRAKESLSIHYHGDFFDSFQAEGIDKRLDPVFYNELNEIVLQLGFRDVYLDLFKNDRRKEYILKHLRCGDPLIVEGNYFYSQDPGINYPLAQLSRKSQSEVQNYIEKGFNHLEGRVRYIVAWHPKNEENNQEFAVILPSIILRKH